MCSQNEQLQLGHQSWVEAGAGMFQVQGSQRCKGSGAHADCATAVVCMEALERRQHCCIQADTLHLFNAQVPHGTQRRAALQGQLQLGGTATRNVQRRASRQQSRSQQLAQGIAALY